MTGEFSGNVNSMTLKLLCNYTVIYRVIKQQQKENMCKQYEKVTEGSFIPKNTFTILSVMEREC